MTEPNKTDPKKEPLNPGRKDFDELNGRIDKIESSIGGFTKQFQAFMDSNKKTDPKPEPKKEPKLKKEPANLTLDDATKKEIEDLKQFKADREQQDARNHQIGIAKAIAEEKGIKIDSMVDNLLGSDDDTTKANVTALADTITNNAKPTDKGIAVNRDVVTDEKSFMDNLLDNSFGPAKK
ncbi:DUF4355 domain-containing protein [Apilactobacillus timberlakei]|uniref:capsid assembly scaffolding protein Gp46 family protein n=1 Tax=Apilactobacillus timberlakei TaxID=2008380 RepID=UPI00112D7EBC|nr:DUF4355 domain-containing protein [Apilactobacillus timberlakei]TPR19983.1 DUF4355 domain-containing protein [Apilactobacillus timberlakei]TPR21701.1 DUF4355 domain-containing protein [Apilactobacillus timberlakei]TPR22947.1 DUF4355 domain-containing protein [Apilactobacillus timberlakei]